MNRITPEEVKEAYVKTGLQPRRGSFLRNGCACGLGVIYARKTGQKDDNIGTMLGVELLGKYYPINYLSDFWKGFDGVIDCAAANRAQGYKDGREAQQLVFSTRGENE